MAVATGTVLAAAGLGLAGVGTYMQYQSQKNQSEFQAQAIASQRQAEAERRKAMELDAARRRRELIRRSVAARSQALTTTTAQNASGGSALPGAYGGISGRTNVDILGVNQNLQIGRNIFDYNAGSSFAYQRAAMAGGDASFYGGLRSLGGALIQGQGTMNRVGEYFTGYFNPSPSISFGNPGGTGGNLGGVY